MRTRWNQIVLMLIGAAIAIPLVGLAANNLTLSTPRKNVLDAQRNQRHTHRVVELEVKRLNFGSLSPIEREELQQLAAEQARQKIESDDK